MPANGLLRAGKKRDRKTGKGREGGLGLSGTLPHQAKVHKSKVENGVCGRIGTGLGLKQQELDGTRKSGF